MSTKTIALMGSEIMAEFPGANAGALRGNRLRLGDSGNAASVGAYTEAKIAALEARIAALEGK